MKSRIMVYLAFLGLAGGGAWFYTNNQNATPNLIPTADHSQSVEVEENGIGPELLIASDSLPRGTLITKEHFQWQTFSDFEGDLSRTYIKGITDAQTLEGFVLRTEVQAGDILTPADFIKPGEHNYLSAVLKPGKRAVTIPIDMVSGSSGLIKPGNHVDVILSTNQEGYGLRGDELSGLIAKTILQKARVLAINQSVDNLKDYDAFDVKKHGTATLETSAEQAELLTIARKMGELSLSLRSEFADPTTSAADSLATASEVVETFTAPIQTPSLILMHGTKRRNLSVQDSGTEVVGE